MEEEGLAAASSATNISSKLMRLFPPTLKEHEEEEEEEEILPRELDPEDWELMTEEDYNAKAGSVPHLMGPYFAEVDQDRLTARYCGKANHAYDVGVVKGDRPLPRRKVRIVNQG